MKKYLLTIVLISSILSAQETKNKLENANNKNEIVNSTTTTSENYNKENLKYELNICSCFKNCYDNFCEDKKTLKRLKPMENAGISSLCFDIEKIIEVDDKIEVSTSTEKEFINFQYKLCNDDNKIFFVKSDIKAFAENFSNFGKNFVACLTPCIQRCDIVKQYKQKIEDEEKLKKKQESEEKKNKILEVMKKLGYKDNEVWLKYAYKEKEYLTTEYEWITKNTIRGLEKVKVQDINCEKYPIIFNVITSSNISVDIKVYIDEFTEDEIKKSVTKIFYLKNPVPDLIKKWGKKIVKSIQEGEIFMGMTSEQVKMSWGEPDDVNRTVTEWGVHEQWVYEESRKYLYFEDGKLTSWQE
jgi:hypothetical protein